jgi:hypothetical protein
MLYSFFWVIPRCLNFTCRRFGTLSVPSSQVVRTKRITGKRLMVFIQVKFWHCGSGSSVGIATELRDGRSVDRIPVGRDFPLSRLAPGAHPASCTMGTGFFPGVNCGWGVLLTNHPLLMPRSRKGRAIPLTTLEAI